MTAQPTKAMVLAAGLGLRMRPITDQIPKPLIEVAGRTLLDRALDRLEAAGVESAVVNAHYLADAIVRHMRGRKAPAITISREELVSQPLPFGRGETVVTEQAQVQVEEQTSKVLLLPASASLSDVVKALNAVGATPSDLLAILQAMKAAGALKADLEVI